MIDLHPVSTIVYLALGVPLIAYELASVWAKRRGDTISEHWWWLQERFPWLRWLMRGFLLWLALHLTRSVL